MNGRMDRFLERAKAYRRQGDLERASHWFMEAQKLLNKNEDSSKWIDITIELAECEYDRKNYSNAASICIDVVHELKEQPDRSDTILVDVLYTLGCSRLQTGNALGALEPLEEALSLLQKDGSRPDTAMRCLGNIGTCHYILKSYDDSERVFKLVLYYFKQLNRHNDSVITYFNLARIYVQKNDYQQAQKMLKRASSLLAKVPNNRAEEHRANLAAISANVFMGLDDLNNAEAEFRKAEKAFTTLGDVRNAGSQIGNLGIVALRRGNLEKAHSLLDTAVKCCLPSEAPIFSKNLAEVRHKMRRL